MNFTLIFCPELHLQSAILIVLYAGIFYVFKIFSADALKGFFYEGSNLKTHKNN